LQGVAGASRERDSNGPAIPAELNRPLAHQDRVDSEIEQVKDQRIGPGGSSDGEDGSGVDAVPALREIYRDLVIENIDPRAVGEILWSLRLRSRRKHQCCEKKPVCAHGGNVWLSRLGAPP